MLQYIILICSRYVNFIIENSEREIQKFIFIDSGGPLSVLADCKIIINKFSFLRHLFMTNMFRAKFFKMKLKLILGNKYFLEMRCIYWEYILFRKQKKITFPMIGGY